MATHRSVDIPAGLRGPLFARLLAAWADARQVRDPEHRPLHIAVGALAVFARAHVIPVADVLKALDAVTDAHRGGDPALRWDHIREVVGRTAIATYYRDD